MSRVPRTDLLAHLFADIAKGAEKRKAKGKEADKAQLLRGMLMPHQARLERDRQRRVAVRSARQVGKSTGILLIVAIRCLEKALSDWVVIGLTRPSVKRIYWTALQRLSDAFELGIKFQHQELTATFPNGSRIYFVGAENYQEIEKLRGGRYHGAAVDECKSFGLLLFSELLTDVLEPALMGQGGQLYLIGTPGDVLAGDFYLATCEPAVTLETSQGQRLSNRQYIAPKGELVAVWSLHVWTLQDNVTLFTDPVTNAKFTLWDRALETKANRGWADNHPTWQREYLGLWVAMAHRIVYRYRPHVHDYRPNPDSKARFGLSGDATTDWRTVSSWDLGSKDGTAVVVWAYSITEPGLWEVFSERRKSTAEEPLNIAVIARWYRELEERFGPFEANPCDLAGLATMVVETLAVEHSVYFEPAEKNEKNDYIELFNNDLDANQIHILRGSELSTELLENRWLEKTIGTEKRKEDPATPNDTCDAGLYGWRWCNHRRAKPVVPGLELYSQAWWADVAEREMEQARNRAKEANNKVVLLDRDWWMQ